jgi:20S proteasome alpha/beta subunit
MVQFIEFQYLIHNMTVEQAIEIINQAINQGFKGGIYSLQDATFIVQALKTLENENDEQITEIVNS